MENSALAQGRLEFDEFAVLFWGFFAENNSVVVGESTGLQGQTDQMLVFAGSGVRRVAT